MWIINVNMKREDHEVFAIIFQDKSVDDLKVNQKFNEKNKLNAETKSEKFECVCDKKHSFWKCFYLVKSI